MWNNLYKLQAMWILIDIVDQNLVFFFSIKGINLLVKYSTHFLLTWMFNPITIILCQQEMGYHVINLALTQSSNSCFPKSSYTQKNLKLMKDHCIVLHFKKSCYEIQLCHNHVRSNYAPIKSTVKVRLEKQISMQ